MGRSSQDNLFAPVAREYAAFRPGYPPELFAWLANRCTAREAAWDCGCGSGQASAGLAAHFDLVWATDVSSAQIAAAAAHPRVRYAVASAERSGLASACVNLVTVAQALHWFDVAAFYEEARRVARPGAIIAVWTYPRPRFLEPALEAVLADFYGAVVGPYWPAERCHVEVGYRSLPFPFAELSHPGFGLELDWDLDHVVGYVSSWSATARYRETRGRDPLPLLTESLGQRWPPQSPKQRLFMPLALRVGRLA